MLKNYDFENIKEPDRRRIAIEALRLELCDVLYHLRRAQHSSFGSNGMIYLLMHDYGLNKIITEHGEGPMWDLHNELGDKQKKVMQILLCTSEYADKEQSSVAQG